MKKWLQRLFPPAGECRNCERTREEVFYIKEMALKAEAGLPFGGHMDLAGPGVKVWACMMADWFKRDGGINFVTAELRDPRTGQRYSITMQKEGGETPAYQLTKLREELRLAREPGEQQP